MKTGSQICLTIAFALALAQATAVRGQDENPTTPGAIPNPGTYQGSMQLQQQEQQRDQQMQMQNQQMQQRLDNTYRQYAPRQGGSAVGGGEQINWWNKPPLPADRNPLLGRWRQSAQRGSTQAAPGSFEDLAAKIVGSTLGGACNSMFGKGVVAFEPDSLQWVAPDGHEEILNHVAYRSNGTGVVVLSRDPGAIPALVFAFPSADHAVVAGFNCAMDRLGARAAMRSAPPAPTAAAPPSGPANAVLKFNVGAATPGYFTPFAGIQIWVTFEEPTSALAKAGITPAADGPLVDWFKADCRIPGHCVRDWHAMTGRALGSVKTDSAGHAETPPIAAGRYYLVGVAPYQGGTLFWHLPVDVQPGSNTVTLDQTNGGREQ
jgi:hypothetical protein